MGTELVLQKLRHQTRNASVLACKNRPGQEPVVYVLDRESASTVAWVADGADDYVLKDCPRELRLPGGFAWIEFPLGDHMVGVLVNERKPDEFVVDPENKLPALEYVLGVDVYWCPVAGGTVKKCEVGGMFWQNAGEWEMCGGFDYQTDDRHVTHEFSSAADVVRGLLYLFTMGKWLNIVDTPAPVRPATRGMPQPPSYALPVAYKLVTCTLDPDAIEGDEDGVELEYVESDTTG